MSDTKQIKSSSIKNGNDDTLLNLEKCILYKRTANNNKILYDTFDNEFNLYLMKIPETPCKKVVSLLHAKKIIYVGTPASSSKPGIYGAFETISNKLTALVLFSTMLNIDITSGETSDIDSCIYTSYQQFIRAAVVLNYQSIKIMFL